MRFSELVDKLSGVRTVNSGDAEVTGIAYDSRQVEPGFVFIAMQGGTFDGHQFVARAIEAGAAAVVAEREVEGLPSNVPYVVAPDGRVAMGEIASPFHGYPSRKMKLIGVTGTSGKTTVTHLVQAVFGATGQKAGLIGTLGAKIDGELLKTEHTTPESADVQRILAAMVECGVGAVAMEASSHGLYQGRTLGCEFDCAIFTNIARDHLDFHKTVEAYLDAKLILFRDYPRRSDKPFRAIVNADDAAAGKVLEAAGGNAITFGVNSEADVRASDIEVTDRSVAFTMTYQCEAVPVRMGIGGLFNVYNALAAASAGIALGLDMNTIAKGLGAAMSVPGRFESVEQGQDFGVIVDYAHTPDELENVLRAARNLEPKRLISVFGCGGDRDRGKRPIMGRISAHLADLTVVTSDNPRTEDPDAIIAEILTGIPADRMPSVTVRADRAEAIREALALAQTGDLVVIAGKGHEDYQIFADRTIHFDDREVARKILGDCRLSIDD